MSSAPPFLILRPAASRRGGRLFMFYIICDGPKDPRNYRDGSNWRHRPSPSEARAELFFSAARYRLGATWHEGLRARRNDNHDDDTGQSGGGRERAGKEHNVGPVRRRATTTMAATARLDNNDDSGADGTTRRGQRRSDSPSSMSRPGADIRRSRARPRARDTIRAKYRRGHNGRACRTRDYFTARELPSRFL